ncbi:hypothetical protein Tco_1139184 [Tanacetum coccineum]
MGGIIAQTRFENVSKLSNDSLLARSNTLQSDEDSLKLNELMELLKEVKNSWAKEGRRINAIDADEDITLFNVQDDADNEIFDVDALTALKSVKPKVKGDVIKELHVPVNAASATTKVSAATTTTATILTPRKGIVITEMGTPATTISSQQSQDKGKGIMIEEPVKPKKKDVHIKLDEEAAKKLQAEFDEEERLAREKDEANVALTKEWDDIEAKIEADHELAQRLQAEEQEELSIEEKEKLFQQLLE